jgi:multisubunit Na+/H+ antiporter MnhG subunit
MVVGIWLFISPFVFGYGETHFATNNMIFGAIVVILGVGTIFYEIYHKERFEKEAVGGMERVKERA